MCIKEQTKAPNEWPTLLTTAEVAVYLGLRERKIYELTRQRAIPSTRVAGKLLFPRGLIDQWASGHQEADERARPILAVFAGSQDPLLDWVLTESGGELATLCRGSGDGVQRLLKRDAMVAGLHVLDPATGRYNDPVHLGLTGIPDLVMVRWARRAQGLVLAPGNPLGIRSLADLATAGAVVAYRQPQAAASGLFQWSLEGERVDPALLRFAGHASLSEDNLAQDVRAGEADAGMAVEAAARRYGLDFIPLQEEAFDLALRRRSYFEPAFQQLLAFARTARFRARTAAMGGYDISELGEVTFNA
ncbi:MAG: helix-turn-helix transcriptional regulator [Halofilum sp. (in: g-proteobacteria)]